MGPPFGQNCGQESRKCDARDYPRSLPVLVLLNLWQTSIFSSLTEECDYIT
jgi:hypothetical protein